MTICSLYIFRHIIAAIKRLERNPLHNVIRHYDRNDGKDNAKRLIGANWIPSNEIFNWGKVNKFVSVRLPMRVVEEEKGYLEERRPAADCDPYAACLALMKAIYTDELL